ncbi:hypothetical protein AB0I81_38265 [Nonomuraea sp. NPDC050404]|uniref:hypothetical protein n=1 Tax=Nonomuraea sp. NPDC050404 TaxID=3155783 RepID=UPI0033F41507
MTVEIVPFQSGFVGQAAALLAEAHTPSGAGASSGGWDFADVGVARRLVAESQGTGPAVAAVRDGLLVGFMAATVSKLPGEQSAHVRLHQHASAQHDRRMVPALFKLTRLIDYRFAWANAGFAHPHFVP